MQSIPRRYAGVKQCSTIIVLKPQSLQSQLPHAPAWLSSESILTCSPLGRVSDPKQTRGHSLDTQAHAMRMFAGACRMRRRPFKRFVCRVRHRKPPILMIQYLQAVIDMADVLLVTSLDRLTRRTLEELADSLRGTLYVCPLGNGGISEDSRRSHEFKRRSTVHEIPR